jgi:hypothetical protein
MIKIVVSLELRAKLHNLTEPLELCDEGGQVLAHLTPAICPPQSDRTQPEISREELSRRKQTKGRSFTTAEVLDLLARL